MINRVVLAYFILGVPALLSAMQVTQNTGFTVVSVLLVGAMCGFVLMRITMHEALPVPIPLYLGFALFWLVMLIATLHSQLFLPQLAGALQFKALAMAFGWSAVAIVVPQVIRGEREMGFAERAFGICGLLISASVFAAAAGLGFGEMIEYRGGEVRAFGPLGDQVGFVLVFFALFAAARRSYLELVVHCAAIMVTGTRSAVAALAFGLLLVYWLRSTTEFTFRQFFRWSVRALGVLVLLVAVLLSPAGQFVLERFTNPEMLAYTIAERFGVVSIGIDIFREHPVIGVGYNGYAALVWDYMDPLTSLGQALKRTAANASNQWIQTATDGGIFGVLALLLHVVLVVRYLWKSGRGPAGRPLLGAACAWALCFVVVNQTACWLLPDSLPAFLWFTLMGFAAAAWRLDRVRAA
jgi:O-antigen ligase